MSACKPAYRWIVSVLLATACLAAALGCARMEPLDRAPTAAESEEATHPLAQLEQAVKDDPRSAEARIKLGNAYLQQKRYKEATHELQQALAADPKNVEVMLALAAIVSMMGDNRSYMALTKRMMELEPEDPRVLNARGLGFLRHSRDLEAAEKLYDKALQLHPDDRALRFNAARCAAAQGKWEQVKSHLGRVIEGNPEDREAALLLVTLLLNGGQIEDAETQINGLLQRFGEEGWTWELAARVYQAAGRPQDTRQAYLNAARLRPQSATPLLAAAQTSLQLGEPEAALEQYDEALQRSPDTPVALMGKALALDALNRRQEAIAVYQQMLEDQPENAVILNNLAFLYADQGINLDSALELAERARQATPDNFHILDTLAWIHYQRGEFGPAIKLLRQTIEIAPQHADAHYHLGKVLLATNRPEEAAQSLQKALELGLPPNTEKDARAVMPQQN